MLNLVTEALGAHIHWVLGVDDFFDDAVGLFGEVKDAVADFESRFH